MKTPINFFYKLNKENKRSLAWLNEPFIEVIN